MSDDIPTPDLTAVRHPLLEVWTQAWPIIITMTSYTVMQFVDKLMVGQVGPLELAAQGNGGIWAFTPMAFAMGAMVVVNTWVSQHMGAGNTERVARYLWGALLYIHRGLACGSSALGAAAALVLQFGRAQQPRCRAVGQAY